MKSKSKIGAALLATVALAATAHGAQISGVIGFAGVANLDNTNLGTATAVSSWTNPFVGATSDSFSIVAAGSPVTLFAPWSFNSGPIANFWQVGGFTFNLTNSAVLQQNAEFLDVRGTGVLTGNNFDATPGTWRFSTQAPGGGTNRASFTFSSSTSAVAAQVPDGGATLALLGTSFLGLGGLSRLIRRK